MEIKESLFISGVFLLGGILMENVYVMESTSRYSGIHLSEREMEIIKCILEFGVFPAGNIHRLFNAGVKNPRSKYAVSMRLGKLVKSGILVQLKTDFPKQGENRPPNYAYRIGSRGFDLLVQQEVISPEEAKRRKKYGSQLNMPTPHNKTINTIFTDLIARLIERDESLESLQCQYFRGDRHPGISYANSQTGYSPVIPDWIYETKDQIICLELDTGRQTNSIINVKFDRYKRLCEHLEKPLTVVFSVGLSTLATEEAPKEKRIGSLKHLFSEHTEWPANFDLFVLPSHRTLDFLYGKLKKPFQFTKSYRKGSVINWVNYARLATKHRLSYRVIQNNELDRLTFGDINDLDLVIEISLEKRIVLTGLLYMEEGSVRSFQRARTNMIRIQYWNTHRRQNGNKVSLFLVYSEKKNGVHDVLSLDPLCSTFIVNIEEVLYPKPIQNRVFLEAIEVLTPYTRKSQKLI